MANLADTTFSVNFTKFSKNSTNRRSRRGLLVTLPFMASFFIYANFWTILHCHVYQTKTLILSVNSLSKKLKIGWQTRGEHSGELKLGWKRYVMKKICAFFDSQKIFENLYKKFSTLCQNYSETKLTEILQVIFNGISQKFTKPIALVHIKFI